MVAIRPQSLGVDDRAGLSSGDFTRAGWQHRSLSIAARLAGDDDAGLASRGSLSSPISPEDAESGVGEDSVSSSRDTDSAVDVGVESSTVSLQDGIFMHVKENGRTYHAFNEGKYVLPNDEKEQERLDLQHHLFLLTHHRLHVAPLPRSVHNVLDIGTGTGLWAVEFAQEYPMANVVGSDLSPIQTL